MLTILTKKFPLLIINNLEGKLGLLNELLSAASVLALAGPPAQYRKGQKSYQED